MRTGYLLKRDIRRRKLSFLATVGTVFITGILLWFLLVTMESIKTKPLTDADIAGDLKSSLNILPSETLALSADSFKLLSPDEDLSTFLVSQVAIESVDLALFISQNKSQFKPSFEAIREVQSVQTQVRLEVESRELRDISPQTDGLDQILDRFLRVISISDTVWESSARGTNSSQKTLSVPSNKGCFLGASLVRSLGLNQLYSLQKQQKPLNTTLRITFRDKQVTYLNVEQVMLSQADSSDNTLTLSQDTFDLFFSQNSEATDSSVVHLNERNHSFLNNTGSYLLLIPSALSLTDFSLQNENSFNFLPWKLSYDQTIFDSLQQINDSLILQSGIIEEDVGFFAQLMNSKTTLLLVVIELFLFIGALILFVFLIVKGLTERQPIIIQLLRMGFSVNVMRVEILLYYLGAFLLGMIPVLIIIFIYSFQGVS